LAVTPSSGVRLAGIEGLRALAASSIVLVHTWSFSTPDGPPWSHGASADALSTLSVGVTLFFTLSGFLLYRPFAAAIARHTEPLSIRAYLRNRVLRIVPAYWAILFATGLLLGAAAVRTASGGLTTGRFANPADAVQAALFLQDYHPRTMVIGIGPAWSLAVEIVFYAALPLLVLAAGRAARGVAARGTRVAILLGPPLLLLAIGLSGKAIAHYAVSGRPTAGYGVNWHSVVERSFWAQADLFSFGMAIAVVHTEVADGRLRLREHWRRVALALSVIVFVPCAWTMHQGEQSYLLQNTGEALAIALAFATVVMPDRPADRPLRAVRVLESRVLVAVGLASYSLFLWHLPLINWLREHGLTFSGPDGLLINLVLVAAVAGSLSALTYRFVERPALAHKRSMRRTRAAHGRTAVSAPAAAIAPAAKRAIPH
jgi:peptidoglycan/LPS O-acetylase OafA/YrhL